MSNRRTFLKQGSAGLVGAAALEWSGATLAAKASESIVVGAIGCGGRGTYLAKPEGFENCVVFYGTDGWMLLNKNGIVKVFDRQNHPRPISIQPAHAPSHQEDFLDAIRTSRQPNAEIAIGHVSATLCHLGNIATRVGRALRTDPSTGQIVGDEEAARLVKRSYREGHWAVPKGV